MKTAKYQYGEVLNIAPTAGLDLLGGEIEIVGVLRYDRLPSWLAKEQWLTGHSEDDWDTISSAWYIFAYSEDEESNSFYIPEWALEFAAQEAEREIARQKRIQNGAKF